MSCKKHPKYKAIYKPRVDCIECWLMYNGTVRKLKDEVWAKILKLMEGLLDG